MLCTYCMYLHVHMLLSIFTHAKSLQSCLTLCNSLGCSPSGFPVHGILQERIWSGLPSPSSGIFPTQGLNPHLLCLLHWQLGSLPVAPPVYWWRWGNLQSRSRSHWAATGKVLTVLPMKPSWLSRPNSARDRCAEPAGLGPTQIVHWGWQHLSTEGQGPPQKALLHPQDQGWWKLLLSRFWILPLGGVAGRQQGIAAVQGCVCQEWRGPAVPGLPWAHNWGFPPHVHGPERAGGEADLSGQPAGLLQWPEHFGPPGDLPAAASLGRPAVEQQVLGALHWGWADHQGTLPAGGGAHVQGGQPHPHPGSGVSSWVEGMDRGEGGTTRPPHLPEGSSPRSAFSAGLDTRTPSTNRPALPSARR